MSDINEGLRANDLTGMVSRIVSIDEYESKIDDAAMVIAFYAANKDAAIDLNRFIQKSHVDLLDTEISAAPDQAGFYLVFVEMMLNAKTAKGISELCRELNSLIGSDQWEIRVRGDDSTEVLKIDELNTSISNKLQSLMNSNFDYSDVSVDESIMCASDGVRTMNFSVDDQGRYDLVYERNNLSEAHINLSSEAVRGCREVKSFLGSQWSVDCLGARFAAHNQKTNKLLLLSFVN